MNRMRVKSMEFRVNSHKYSDIKKVIDLILECGFEECDIDYDFDESELVFFAEKFVEVEN